MPTPRLPRLRCLTCKLEPSGAQVSSSVPPCSAHPDIAKVAFTGSGPVGRQVNLAAAHNVKPATLELGGKSALIVFDDADIDKAVEWAMVRRLRFCVKPTLVNSLQNCTARNAVCVLLFHSSTRPVSC